MYSLPVNSPDASKIAGPWNGDPKNDSKTVQISFRSVARVFFDYDRIELFDVENSDNEERYDTIGDTTAGAIHNGSTIIGNAEPSNERIKNDILFVVYTERVRIETSGEEQETMRLISARLATNFERGLYYGKYD